MVAAFLFILAILPYLALALWLWRGWKTLSCFEETDIPMSPVRISVVVPMRNEAHCIGQLLQDVVLQQYPTDSFHVLLIDDHSTDHTTQIVQEFSEQYPNITLWELPEGAYGKKAALRYALSKLDGELVVTTDADCRVPPAWLTTIANYYTKYRPVMIICPVLLLDKPSFFAKWQTLELISLIGSSAASAAQKHPVMCSGANLAMERTVMMQYAHAYDSTVVSGDDMFMMQEIKKISPERIRYLKSVNATVKTAPQDNLKSFIRQRNRWTSKSSGYTDKEIIAVALTVFLANVSIVMCLLVGCFHATYLGLACILWLAKTLVDWPFLASLTNFWQRKKLMRLFIPTQLLYPFYVVWVSIAGNLLPVNWKERKYKN